MCQPLHPPGDSVCWRVDVYNMCEYIHKRERQVCEISVKSVCVECVNNGTIRLWVWSACWECGGVTRVGISVVTRVRIDASHYSRHPYIAMPTSRCLSTCTLMHTVRQSLMDTLRQPHPSYLQCLYVCSMCQFLAPACEQRVHMCTDVCAYVYMCVCICVYVYNTSGCISMCEREAHFVSVRWVCAWVCAYAKNETRMCKEWNETQDMHCTIKWRRRGGRCRTCLTNSTSRTLWGHIRKKRSARKRKVPKSTRTCVCGLIAR